MFTRLFNALPSGVSLDATGRESAYPAADSFSGSIPHSLTRNFTTFTALWVDNSQFDGKDPLATGMESVCPSTRIDPAAVLSF